MLSFLAYRIESMEIVCDVLCIDREVAWLSNDQKEERLRSVTYWAMTFNCSCRRYIFPWGTELTFEPQTLIFTFAFWLLLTKLQKKNSPGQIRFAPPFWSAWDTSGPSLPFALRFHLLHRGNFSRSEIGTAFSDSSQSSTQFTLDPHQTGVS